MAKQDDGLFLLEVLIDKIVFVKSPCFSDKDFRTCVNIECPAVEPLEICDDDPGACVAKSGGPFVKTFNNGKSCLFSLKESDIASAMSKFPVNISVYKSLPCGCLPTKIVMGKATIDMTKEFVQARKKFLEDPTTVSYQALKDSFRITGPDGTETGEIVMFLRISCFGKLIITRFQGGGGPPNLGTGSGANTIVDRSCNPRRDFQSTDDPCACGAARAGAGGGVGAGGSKSGGPCSHGSGGGGAVCPAARDPYNSMPCEDPDDPCYCTGPKPPNKPPMVCRNTDQYCLHVPKGTLPNLPFTQELSEEQKMDIKETCLKQTVEDEDYGKVERDDYKVTSPPLKNNLEHFLKISVDQLELPCKSYTISEKYSATSFSTIRSKRRSVSFSNTINYVRKSQQSLPSLINDQDYKKMLYTNNIFGEKETTIYMTLFDEFCRYRSCGTQSTTGTQATASINKCLQVHCKESLSNTVYTPSSIGMNSNYYSSCTMSTMPIHNTRRSESMRYSDVYFFGRKKENQKPSKVGMGSSGSNTKLSRQGQTTTMPVTNSSKTAQTARKARGASAGTNTKQVSIKEEKQCPTDKVCPAMAAAVKGDMAATVSHIRLGPREPCPVHGKDPCQGPNCIVASSGQEQAPVKVTTMTNPRRGVFELVIRRITGAPLAKNELMLEWTPPPSRPPSCIQPCTVPCVPSVPCRPSKCKMIVCRPSPCKPKGCRKPCGPLPCRSVPCKLCYRLSCTGKPCRLKPCKPCRPCKPKPCSPCATPRCCKPCRPCPPPRKIFKRPCRPCKPCGRPPCRPCPPSPCSFCSLCSPVPCKPRKPCLPLCQSPPCRPPPCRPAPCKPCRSCRSPSPCRACRRCRPCPPSPCKRCKRCRPPSPCQPCVPCPPALCSPCPPSPCSTPCCKSPCSSPCKSSPCLRPCPIGRKKTRKSKSQPKIKGHRKRISPCCNRSKTCPVVRCRSVPGPCLGCCRIPPCPPRKCCSILPCKPPKCCKSSCSSCCG